MGIDDDAAADRYSRFGGGDAAARRREKVRESLGKISCPYVGKYSTKGNSIELYGIPKGKSSVLIYEKYGD